MVFKMKQNKIQTYLFTGGTGFLGSNILKTIVSQSVKIIVLKRKSSNLKRIESIVSKLDFHDVENTDIEKLFRENSIEKIIHCATNYGKKRVSSTDILQANLILPLRLLELGEKYGTKCFINTDTVLDMRVSEYSLSKNQFKQWLKTFAKKMVCVNVEIEHFYGPDDDHSKFVSSIIHSLLMKVDKIDLTMGEQKRCFIYIDDVVDAFVKIINRSNYLERGYFNFQVGSEEAIKIREFVEKVKALTGNTVTKLNFGALQYRTNEVMSLALNLSELKRLGWKQNITLDGGLIKTVKIEKSNLEEGKSV